MDSNFIEKSKRLLLFFYESGGNENKDLSYSSGELVSKIEARNYEEINQLIDYLKSERLISYKKLTSFSLGADVYQGLKLTPKSRTFFQTGGFSYKVVRKVLFLASNPIKAKKIRFGEEMREIQDSLKSCKESDKFEFISKTAVRPKDLSNSILEHKPEIIHFSGCGYTDQSIAGIILEDDNGNAQRILPNALAELFELFSCFIKCVILNSCFSVPQGEIISKFIPYVIGLNSSIDEQASIKFSSSFYYSLGTGATFEFSYNFAKKSLALFGFKDEESNITLINR